MIDSYISQYLPSSLPLSRVDSYFDTGAELIACAQQSDGSEEALQTLEFVCKRVEISRCLYRGYLESGGRSSTELLSVELTTLALLLLFKDMLRLASAEVPTGAIKRLNAVLKLLDTLQEQKAVLDQELQAFIQSAAEEFLAKHQHDGAPAPTPLDTTNLSLPGNVLAVTVLFWEGPIARAYLATLKSMGLKAEKIIHLVSKKDLTSKKPVGRFLPGNMRLTYAQFKQRNSIHHWSGVLRRTESELYASIKAQVESGFGVPPSTFDDALALQDLSEYSLNVEHLLIDDLGDDKLLQHLRHLTDTHILFTGGGIVPRKLLELQHLKFIHVHPGFLPEVRGADCALWSQLMKGSTSATCFYMAPGIDDGDVILPMYLPALTFQVEVSNTQQRSLYRAVYAFFDPWIRATVLRQAILLTEGFARVNAQAQDETNSVTYHFMHQQIQRHAFQKFFPLHTQ